MMLIRQKLIQLVRSNSKLKRLLQWVAYGPLSIFFPRYPMPLGGEVRAVKRVLKTPSWNMTYGNPDAPHHKLEERFAASVGAEYALAVGSGGMAIQMLLRGLGFQHGDELIHIVDTCMANPFSIINAGITPIFVDTDPLNMRLNYQDLELAVSSRSKVLMPIHLWGLCEDMDRLTSWAKSKNLTVIEDCATSFGQKYKGQSVGIKGAAGMFSFGAIKPLQAGEGGMIVTNDAALHRELLALRSYGDTSFSGGKRDHKTLAWNGRMSEIVAAVALAQISRAKEFSERVCDNNFFFRSAMKNRGWMETPIAHESPHGFMDLPCLINAGERSRQLKQNLLKATEASGFQTFHGHFEPIPSFSFFKYDEWKKWLPKADMHFCEKNYRRSYNGAEKLYQETGFLFMKTCFLSRSRTKRLIDLVSNCANEL